MTIIQVIRFHLWLAGILLIALSAAQAETDSRSLQLLKEQYHARHAEFAREMNALADFCEANSFFTDAERIRIRASSTEQGSIDFDDLPTQKLPELPKQLGPIETQWRTKLRALETDYAVDLYLLARRSMKQRHASFAFQLIRELVFFDPDHKSGRELLGYVTYGDEWTTPFSRSMRSSGFLDHPQYGWIRNNLVERFEQGERLYRGRWMSVEKEASLRKEFRNGWEIQTEHFHIKTNHSLEKGVQISRQLEAFHRFFLREFAAFFSTPVQMQKLFGSGAVSKDTRQGQHQIYYFANRDEFVAALKSKNQQTLIATGFYLPHERTAFFYHDDDPEQAEANRETMFHEVTHQLLGESSSATYDVGEHRNFWVIEGIACYMESFELDHSGETASTEPDRTNLKTNIGDPKHPRIYWARRKALQDDFYIPMERFMLYGKKEFQSAPDNETLHAYYSQATGLVHFFMHYEDGLYRDAFIDYLSQVYSPIERVRTRPDSLDKLTQVPFATLDQQYRDYLQSLQTQ